MIAVGDRLPKATLIKVTPNGPDAIDTEEYFRGRRVALFAVPGAFTPTCSNAHLPSFVNRFDELKGRGVDEVACTAVNDPFVLDAWSKQAGAEGVTMLADGNGHFAEAIGLSADSSKFGMGTRSRRYAMLVNDGVVEQVHVEAPGEFKVSSADHLLANMV